MSGLPNLAATLGGWSARHRLTAVGAGRRPPLAGHPGRVEPGLQRVPSPSLEDP